MNVTLRPAVASDIPEILEIVNDAIANTTAIYDYNPRTHDFQLTWLENKLAAGFPVIVADLHGKAIGFGAYGTFREREAYRTTVEHSVYVSENYQGNGIGKLLLQELIALAKDQKLHLMIGAIDASNAGSIAFHRQMGFSEAAVIRQVAFKFDKWLDLTLMELRLE